MNKIKKAYTSVFSAPVMSEVKANLQISVNNIRQIYFTQQATSKNAITVRDKAI